MEAMEFLRKKIAEPERMYVLAGEERFLKRLAALHIRKAALGDDEDGLVSLAGDQASFAQVFDELETAPFFSSCRLVVISEADPFVTKWRGEIEGKVGRLPATGILVLDVKSWPANTRLAKMISDKVTIQCKPPAAFRMPAWCTEWAKSAYEKELPAAAASLLVDLTGPEMGLLDQELLKLATFVGDKKRIEPTDVDRIVGNHRAQNVWKIFDAIADGNIREALRIVDRLLEDGEEPMRLLGAFSSSLRKLAQAGRLAEQGMSLGAALQKAGVLPFQLQNAEKQMRLLGRSRVGRLYDALIELNLDMRGNSTLGERLLFERFFVRLARRPENAPAAART